MFIFKLFLIVVLGSFVHAKSKSPYQESISFDVKMTGDLLGQYSFSGPVNSKMQAESDLPESKCSVDLMVRKVLNLQKKSIEVWPTLNCLFEGQKKVFKLHRIYVALDQEGQKHSIKSIDKNIQMIHFEFANLSLQKGK